MSTFTNQSKNSTTFSIVNLVKSGLRRFLLKEDGKYLLLETGGKIIIEPDGGAWSLQKKN